MIGLMSDETEIDWSQAATRGDVALVRKDMDLLRKDMDLLRKDMDLMRKDMDLLESRLRRRIDLQSVFVVLALLGSPLVSSLAQRYVPALP